MSEWQRPSELPDLRRVDKIGFDIETCDKGLAAGLGAGWPWHGGYICGVNVAYRREGGMCSDYFPIAHPDSDNFDREQVFQWVRDHVKSGPKFTLFNANYDFGWLRSEAGIRMPPPDRLADASAAEALINENEFEYNLDAVAKRYGLPGKDTTLLEQACKAAGFKISRKTPLASYIWQLPAHLVGPYAAADPVQTLELHDKQDPILDREGLRPAYQLEIELLQVLLEMRLRGIKVNQARAIQARDRLFAKRDAALSRISELIGEPINLKQIRSPDWKAKTFDARGIAYPRTKLGNPSFEGGVEGWMTKAADELPRAITEALTYHNAADKFLDKFILKYTVNGRIHAEINQFRREDGGTVSSRFSYKNPALQQMPSKNEELTAEIRGVFEPDDSEIWFDADISQQEFRRLVDVGEQYALPGAREMADAYRNDPDADAHAIVSSLVELERKFAKGCNFAKIYGMGLKAFAAKIGKTEEEARSIMDKYDAKLPFAKKLSDITQKIVERNGHLVLLDGARRRFDLFEAAWVPWTKGAGPCGIEEARLRVADPGHPWYRKELRRAGSYKALNALIQGDSARWTKIWLRDVYYQTGIVPLLQMHDALSFSVKNFEQAEMVAKLGCKAIDLSVPIRIDMGFGRTWGEASRKDATSWAALRGDTTPGHDAKYVIAPAGVTAASRPPPQMPARKPLVSPDRLAPQPLAASIRFTPPDAILAAGLDDTVEDAPPPGKSNGHGNGHDVDPPSELSPTAIEVHKIGVTGFKNISAQVMAYNQFTLQQIATDIATRTAKSKEDLPLLKLQRFGDQRTDKNCLRSDANVIEIFGIEGEHDAGTMSFAKATKALHEAHLRGIVYTSPSYVPATRERWRVLAPTSGPLAPSLRTGLVARLNGILGGVLAPTESFTLSQSFYYGRVDGNENHQVRIFDGDFIDQRPDLDAGAIFKGKTAEAPGAPATEMRTPSEPWEDLVVKILAGDILHPNLVTLSAKLVKSGMDGAAVANFLRGLLEKSAAVKDKRWQERYDDIDRIVESAEAKFAPEPTPDLSQLWAKLKGIGAPGPASAPVDEPADEPAPSSDLNAGFRDNVNKRFANLDEWVPEMFPGVEYGKDDTPIDIVLKHTVSDDDTNAPTEAALWLCQEHNRRRKGPGLVGVIFPQALGYNSGKSSFFSGTTPPPDDHKAFFDKVNEAFPEATFPTWKWKVFPNADAGWTRFTENYHTAIDTVVLYGGAPDALAAALLLCKSAGIDPKALGYIPPPGGAGAGAGSTCAGAGTTGTASGPPPLIDARPFVLRDPKTLTKRDWVYGTQLIRKFGSATFAPSGSGKSNLFIAEALAMATGRPLLGILPPKRVKVWYWNGEDPYDELERRIGAACLHYGIAAADIDGWLFVNSGRDPNSAVIIAQQDRNGTTFAIPVIEALVATIRAKAIDVVMIDPFISSHQVPENDNNAIDAVAKTWTTIADITNTAIDLAHHTRKTGGAEVTVEDGRGASALLNAVRPARVLNVMTEDEAARAAVVDGRRRYFKVEDGKNNLALPPDKLDWFRSESIFLGNGDPNDPNDHGDDMGVVTAWEWPDVMKGVTTEDFEKVAATIQAGKWRHDIQAADWAGIAIARALKWENVAAVKGEKMTKQKKTLRAQVSAMLGTWIHEGRLVVVEHEDKKRMLKRFVEVADEVAEEVAA